MHVVFVHQKLAQKWEEGRVKIHGLRHVTGESRICDQFLDLVAAVRRNCDHRSGTGAFQLPKLSQDLKTIFTG